MLALVAAALLAAAPQNDTIHTPGGGRIVGTVVEEGPQGITVRLLDGTIRQLRRSEVDRIDYADGSVSTPSSPAPPPPVYAPRQPPAYAPPETRFAATRPSRSQADCMRTCRRRRSVTP